MSHWLPGHFVFVFVFSFLFILPIHTSLVYKHIFLKTYSKNNTNSNDQSFCASYNSALKAFSNALFHWILTKICIIIHRGNNKTK
jgi:hypothetical protein